MASFAMTSSTTIVRKIKNSKKNQAPPVCTWRNFVGSSKYRNCKKVETKIQIECGDEDAEETTRMCQYSEHPWNDEKKEEDTDAAAAACNVHGSFDPNTHITTDSATGLCHLKFLPLFDSCDVDANGSPSGVFGMKAEIHNSHNTENHNDDNSGMLIRFSRTGGVKYYNDDDPQKTFPLHAVIPAERKLQTPCVKSVGSYDYKNPTHFCYTFVCPGDTLVDCWSSQGGQCQPHCTVMFSGMNLDGVCGEPCTLFADYQTTNVCVYDDYD